MGILREDQEEIAGADDGVHARAVGIAGRVLRLVVRDGLDNLRKWLAANEFRPLQGELDVDIPPMGLIPLRVHEAGRVLAHHRLDPQVKLMRPNLHVRSDGRDVIQRQVDRRRQAFIEADVLNVVVNHRMKCCCCLLRRGFGVPISYWRRLSPTPLSAFSHCAWPKACCPERGIPH